MSEKRIPVEFFEEGLVPQMPQYTFDDPNFPISDELPEGTKTLNCKDCSWGYPIDLQTGIVYAERDGHKLHIDLIMPDKRLYDEGFAAPIPDKKWPLIVYVQGSGWLTQTEPWEHLPHALRIAQHGYAVALVQYRGSEENAPFPAQVEDAKTAIRFLRANAEKYNLDTERVSLWGDSSGGHTVLMVGATGDNWPNHPDDAKNFPGQTVAAKCVVEFYGPTEISKISCYPSAFDHISSESMEGLLIGGKNVLDNLDLARKASVLTYVTEDCHMPPLLIMHGDSDKTVPFNQSCRLYEKMKAMGKEVEFYKLLGGEHGFYGFCCDTVLEVVEKFIGKYMD